MKIVQIQFAPWDKSYNFDPGDVALINGNLVLVKTDLGVDLGKVAGFKEVSDVEMENGKEIKTILRKATATDLEKIPDDKQKKKDMEFCKRMIEKYGLAMKLIDIHYSFDGSRITFAFIADGRIDFRELVKDLTRHFNKTIRLQQIGIRDEAKLCGDYGHCGLPLCCGRFLNELSSITSEMAEQQQCVHRGSERISGVCGRLMCCLSYEEAGYKKMAEKMPPIDSEVRVEGKRGRVRGHHMLKQTVEVEIYASNGEASSLVEVEVEKIRRA